MDYQLTINYWIDCSLNNEYGLRFSKKKKGLSLLANQSFPLSYQLWVNRHQMDHRLLIGLRIWDQAFAVTTPSALRHSRFRLVIVDSTQTPKAQYIYYDLSFVVVVVVVVVENLLWPLKVMERGKNNKYWKLATCEKFNPQIFFFYHFKP